MKPIGPLMREHRVIERMITLMEQECHRMQKARKTDFIFVSSVIDFFKIYVDRTHHDKEEQIQFKKLETKDMTPELRRIMKELIDEHDRARAIITALDRASISFNSSDTMVLQDIIDNFRGMIELYPMHIEKEDKHFFYPTLDYLTREEQDAMLHDFWEFDRNIIHEKYNRVIEDMKARLAKSPV